MVGPLRVAFFGTPDFAVPTLEALLGSPHTVCGVVTQPDRPQGRGRHTAVSPIKAVAETCGIPVLQPTRVSEPEAISAVRGWQLDLGVVAAYGQLLPDDLLAVPRLGMINVHASLLPAYRGAAPIHRAVLAGEPVTGVTIMRVVRRLDAGPMMAKVDTPIGPDDASDEIESRLAIAGAHLLISVVDRMAAGPVWEEPQDGRLATYAPRLTKADGLIDWTHAAAHIHNQVRGLFPWPHAYSFLDGHRLTLFRTHVASESPDADPGTVLQATSAGIHVATGGHGGLVIESLQADGRRVLDAQAFLAGHPIRVGARFAAS